MIMRKLLILLALLIYTGTALAADRLELSAPGGGELDLGNNLMKYYGAGSDPVTVRWGDRLLQADYLEYHRSREIFKGKGRVRLSQSAPTLRVINCGSIQAELTSDYFTAGDGVELRYDSNTALKSASLEWSRTKDTVKFVGNPLIIYQAWQISGSRIEGRLNAGIFTFFGPVEGTNGADRFRAGRIIFNRAEEKLILQERPAFIRGKNEMIANEIVYDLKTRKISANGPVQSRIIEESN
jgi:lipopolysaccharide export system protein LptA